MDLKKLIFDLCSVEKVSGHENRFAKILKNMLTKYSKNVSVTSNNSVIAKIDNQSENNKKPEIILTAHLDEIGFIVNKICENGLIKLKNCGGINLKLANFQKIIIYGKQKLTGFTFLEKSENGNKTLFADVGLSKTKIQNIISPGDVANFSFNAIEFPNKKICSKNLDDCAGIATIFLILEKLKREKSNYSLTIIFSSQEETTGTGAITAAYGRNTKFAICLDVSFAKFFNCDDDTLGELGNGPMIGVSPVLDLELTETLKFLAKTNKIPFQLEIMSGLTSTDADKIIKIKNGIRTCLCSIPLKYMHSPIEMVSLADIESTATLCARLISKLK